MYNQTATIFDFPSEEGNTSAWLKSSLVMLSQCCGNLQGESFFPYSRDRSGDASGFAKHWGNVLEPLQ